MKTIGEIMTRDPSCVHETATVLDAARQMKELGVGALPICGSDDRLKGMLTDRDIVVKVLAEGRRPDRTEIAQLADGNLVTVKTDDSLDDAMQTMITNQVRRLLVMDGNDLVGVVSQADLAVHLPDPDVGKMVEAISSAP